MKKTLSTLAILLGMTICATAQNGGGLFQRGSMPEDYNEYDRTTGGLILPSQHGQTGDTDAPVGSGIAVLVGLGAAYALHKRRKKPNNHHKLLAAMLTLAALTVGQNAWAQTVSDMPASITYHDNGDNTGYYEIGSPQALYDMQVYVIKGTYSDNSTNETFHPCNNLKFRQTADIDMKDINGFTGIGEGEKGFPFQGHYNGQDHVVRNLTINNGNGSYRGLFGNLLQGVVEHVIVDSAAITGRINIGGIAGFVNSANIQNCFVLNTEITANPEYGSPYSGALVGNCSHLSGCIYYNCSVHNAKTNETSRTNIGNGANADDDNCRHVQKITLGTGVSVTGTGIVNYNSNAYCPPSTDVTLDCTVPDGYSFTGYSVKDANNDDVSVSVNAGVYTFTMPDGDVTVSATLSMNWTGLQDALNNSSTDADNPTVITLDNDIVATSTDSYLNIPAGHHVIIDLNGHTIDRNLTEAKSGGYVFYVHGGDPTKNPASLTIRDNAGGGTITGAYASSSDYGGAIYVNNYSTLIIEGGTITGNKSYINGSGAISASNHVTVRMTGGTITGNVGNASNNAANYAAGAVYLGQYSHFYFSGGSITNNLCGGHYKGQYDGILYGKDGTGGIGFDGRYTQTNRVHLSGTYTLSNNLYGNYENGTLTTSIPSDYLHTQNNVIVIEDAISPTAPAVITVSDRNPTQVLTSGWGNHMTADPATCFTLSSFYNTSGKGLGIVNGEVSIGTLHTITLGDNITASATSAAQGKPITLGYTGTVPTGYAPVFSATAGSINGNILVMPDEDVTVSVIFRLAIPYSYDFEEEWSWDEWSSLSGSNERVQGIHHSGSYNLIFKGSTNNIVVLPQFQNESNTLQISFWTRPESNTMPYCGTFSVGYLTDPADASTFSAVKTYRYDDWTTYNYLQKTVYLNNVPGGARIAFRHNPESTNYYWFVDDVEVSLLPSCIPPENLSVSGIGASAATFSWTAAEGADWEYGIVANAAQNYVPTDADFTGTTTANSVTLNTLSQQTSYTFYLRRACSAQDKSEVVSVSFSTTQTPVAVPFSDDFEGNACQWVLENSNAVNQWYWGNAASCGGTKALYISNDGGNSNSFSTNSSATVYATKMFTFADGDYYFSYNWRCYCYEGGQNYMRVALAPASASLPSNWNSYSLPSGWIALDGGYTLSFASQWQAFQSDAITVPAGQYKMVVVWTNYENTSPLTYPAAIDNISISTHRKTFTTAGYWNEASNWSPEGVPASTEHVRINAAATIPSGCVVEAAGIFIDYDNGSLTLADGGQLVCYHNLNVTVQKEIAAYTTDKNGWNLFAMPFSSNLPPTLINGLIPSDPNTVYDLYRLDEETTYWENYKQHGSDFRIHPNNNYGACLYANSAGATLQRNDQIYPNSVAGETAQLRKQGEGWHLIANPYTCTAYVNKPFLRMNAEGSVLEPVANYWETPLNVCEGIVVKADYNYESVTFTHTAPQAPTTSGGKGSLQIALSQPVPESVERAGVSTGSTTGTLDKAIVSFNEGCQLGKFYFMEQDANIYLPQGGKDYAITSVSAGRDGVHTVSTEVPVNFKARKNGTYTLTVNPEGVEMAYLHLIDNMTGADVDLLASNDGDARIDSVESSICVSTYTFTAKTSDYASRFKLVFRAQEVGPSTGSGTDEAFAYINNGNIIITDADADATLQIVDMAGRVVISDGGRTRCIPTGNLPAGVYVLRLIDGKDVKTQKIVIP